LKVPLRTGAHLPVTLIFEKAGPIDIEFPVRTPGPVGNAVFDHPATQRG
jgi:copper(I)-binding protein